jgi:hypothetical protein
LTGGPAPRSISRAYGPRTQQDGPRGQTDPADGCDSLSRGRGGRIGGGEGSFQGAKKLTGRGNPDRSAGRGDALGRDQHGWIRPLRSGSRPTDAAGAKCSSQRRGQGNSLDGCDGMERGPVTVAEGFPSVGAPTYSHHFSRNPPAGRSDSALSSRQSRNCGGWLRRTVTHAPRVTEARERGAYIQNRLGSTPP